jgi:segregation and condensation protein B
MAVENELKQIVEAALLAAGRPLSLEQLQALFDPGSEPDKKQLREVLEQLAEDYAGRGIELKEVGSGFRTQVRSTYAPWVSRLYAERPPRYSRALLETLALIAYRQPITRGEIEDIRGVSVSSNIVKTLTEREWVRVVGHRDVPGKPALYATTKEFLDYFNLQSLSELPTLAEIRDLDSINRELELKDLNLQEPEPHAEASQDPSEIEEQTMSGEAQENLIEDDPDGETDSGVVQRIPESDQATPPPPPDDSIDFDPDGETDTITELSELPEEMTKRADETE